jgi:hypothetical protein
MRADVGHQAREFSILFRIPEQPITNTPAPPSLDLRLNDKVSKGAALAADS